MVVAHLRGLLPRRHRFGLRSMVSEDIVLETMAAEITAQHVVNDVMSDLALVPALSPQGVTEVARRSNARLARASELKLADVYKVEDQLRTQLRAGTKGELSLFQLYQLSLKSGIFDELDRHYTVENSKKLL